MYKKNAKINRIIKSFIRELSKIGIPVKSIVLYGSYARGNYRKDSDIDLIVISDAFKNMDIRQRQEALGLASVRIMKPIEALGYSSEETKNVSSISILKEALAHGIQVYNY